MSNRTAIEMIKQKLPIESVVGSYIKLEKAGNKFVARCPFHSEKTASFQVNPDRQFFYCFGCHKGGDIFNFVEEIEGVSFLEALKSLAEKANVPLGDYKNEQPSRLGILREIMEVSTKYYEVNFRKTKSAVDYLLSRGMTKETMIAWRIGFAPKGWSGLTDYLKQKKYSDDDIVATGMGLRGNRPGLYDRFRERIMFPICDGQGRVVAFTGRILPGTEEAGKPVGKYINSPETDLYHKSSILFGFDKAKSFIHSKNFAIVVEGQMDCVMAHQAGTNNTIAISGTAFTDEHAKQIKRFTDDIAIALDADAAGMTAAQKTALVAYRNDMNVTIIAIPSGKDPADAIVENVQSWHDAIKNRQDFITFRLEKMKNDSGDKVSIARKELFPVLREFQSQIRIDDKLQEIARAFRQSSVEPVQKDFQEFLKKNPLEMKSSEPQKKQEERDLFGDMIGMILVLQPQSYFEELEKEFEKINGENLFDVLEKIPESEREKLRFKAEAMIGDVSDDAHQKSKFRHLLFQVQLSRIDQDKKNLEKKMSEHPSDETLLRELSELAKRRDAIIHQLIH